MGRRVSMVDGVFAMVELLRTLPQTRFVTKAIGFDFSLV